MSFAKKIICQGQSMRLGTSKIFVLLALGVGGEVLNFAVVIAAST